MWLNIMLEVIILMQQSNLFKSLTAKQLDLSSKLSAKIIQAINQLDGVIPFSQYMQLALYDPELGYYTNLLHKFGRAGDFITASGISNLFGKCLARQILELYKYGVLPNILEFDAGNGQLMLDILHEIGGKLERYYVLELSANLIQLQKQLVQEAYPQFFTKVVWLDQLPQSFCGVILANEVLDAQPCELIAWQDDKIYQRGVSYHDVSASDELESTPNYTQFYYQNYPISEQLQEIASALPINHPEHISEINLCNRGFIKTLAHMLDQGCILLIDYGYSESEYYNEERVNGTLRGFFHQHQLDNVLGYPGVCDITTSVDFSAITNTAINNQLDFIGYTTQANFLFNCGILDYVAQAQIGLNSVELIDLNNQVKRLTLPSPEMGEVFKVIGFSKRIEFDNWLGFTSGDMSHTL